MIITEKSVKQIIAVALVAHVWGVHLANMHV